MSGVNSQHYEKDAQFEDDVLLDLAPYVIYGWMANKVYVTPTTTAEKNSTKRRASSLDYYKKAISHLMSNQISIWDTELKQGNPKRSSLVNGLSSVAKKS